jgi:hypothetical protein
MGWAFLTDNVVAIFRCFSVCLTPILLWLPTVIEPPQKWGSISQDHIRGFSMKRQYANTTHKHTIPWYLSMKRSYHNLSAMYYVYKRWSQKSILKDRTKFLQKQISLTSSTRSSPWKRVGFLRWPTPMSPSREPSPHLSGPPTDNPHWCHQKEEGDPHLHTDKVQQEQSLSDYV